MTTNLLVLIMLVETAGVSNPPLGDHGRARGPLQIHRSVVIDINRTYGTRYTWEEMDEWPKAYHVGQLYFDRVTRGMPHPATTEDLARCWNGGPNGWKKPKTKPYWRRVQRRMGK